MCYGRVRYSLTPTAPRRIRVTPATLMRAQGRRGLPRRPCQAADGGTRAIVRIDAIDVDHYLQLEGHVRRPRRNGRCHCCKHDNNTRTQQMDRMDGSPSRFSRSISTQSKCLSLRLYVSLYARGSAWPAFFVAWCAAAMPSGTAYAPTFSSSSAGSADERRIPADLSEMKPSAFAFEMKERMLS